MGATMDVEPPVCYGCKLFKRGSRKIGDKAICTAYPNGIPKRIWSEGGNCSKKKNNTDTQNTSLTFQKVYEPIIIDESEADSRSLIMPHQQEAVDAMTEYFELDKAIQSRNGIVIMPTGSGKTYTAVTWLLSQAVAKGYRVVWLVHRQELVGQAYWEFRRQAPILKGTGVKKLRILPISGIHLKMSTASRSDVYVCSIASVANNYGYRFIERMLGAAGKRKVVVVVDEAHHSVAANYQKVIKRITALNPNRVLLGLTATPTRMQKSEQRQLQKMYNIDKNVSSGKGMNGYVYEVTLKQLLLSGFLAKPVYEKVDTQIIGEVEYNCTPEDEAFFSKFGELSEKLKNQIAKSSVRNKIILNQYLNNKEKYGKTLIFAVNQMHAETLCDEFKKAGISCDYAISDRSDAQEVIGKFKNNEFDVLINVQILTEGSDVPDIQTVFLTRQTNSDSLLMQMIGRGLRGEKAGGTKIANIVSFHDTWNTFAHWLDPGALEIFSPDPTEDDNQIDNTDDEEIKPPIVPNDETDDEQDVDIVIPPNIDNGGEMFSERDLYLKLYNAMKAALLSDVKTPVYPCGWYSLIDEEGNNCNMLVFDSQLPIYEKIEKDIASVIHKNIDDLSECYFDDCELQPEVEELDYFLEYIKENEAMPPYFSFEQREAIDPKVLADKVRSLFEKEEDMEMWLKQLYDSAPILQNIYKIFYAFKKTVFDAMKDEKEPKIHSRDNRKKYEVIENYYNLNELLTEVKEMFPRLRTDRLVKIAWSNNYVRDWFALCQKFADNGDTQKNLYQIHINKILSSPNIDREVIKYLIFHELLHENGYWNHDIDFRAREWQYPNSAELDGILDSLPYDYDMDEIYKNAVSYEIPEIKLDNERLPQQNETSDNVSSDNNSNSNETEQNSSFNPNAEGVISGYKYCRNCGNKLPDTAKFCDKCGSRIDY